MKKNLLRLAAFVLLLGIIIVGINQLLNEKSVTGPIPIEVFYTLPANTVDVLILGSSHAFSVFDPAVFWEENGVATYVLAGGAQPLWNTYYCLEEALKTQTPKLIILEGFYCAYGPQSLEDASIIRSKTNLLSLKPSQTKYDAILAIAPKDRRLEMFIKLVSYHSRYQNLSKGDFLPYFGNEKMFRDWKGYRFWKQVFVTLDPQLPLYSQADALPLSADVELYYRKILALAQERGIPLLVAIAPYSDITEEHAKRYLSAETIALEYDAAFVNFNLLYDELDLDFSADFCNPNHLNHRGSRKFSEYFSDYMYEYYELPDHRGEASYDSWERNALYMDVMFDNSILSDTTGIYDYIHLLGVRDGLVVVISLSGDYLAPDSTVDLPTMLSDAGIPLSRPGVIVWQNEKELYRSGQGDGEYHMELGSFDLALHYTHHSKYTSVLVNKAEKSKVQNGLNIVVYDSYTDTIVDCVGFDAQNNYAAVRQKAEPADPLN